VRGSHELTHLGTCQAEVPNNIIIFVADDLDWNDLPYFSPRNHFAGTYPAKAEGVCSFDALAPGPGPSVSGAYRRVRGGSCVICDPDATGNPCQNNWCRLEGRVCASSSEISQCDPTTGDPSTQGKDYCASFTPQMSASADHAAYRCEQNSDCPSGLGCVKNLCVPCNRCEPATWKLKTTVSGGVTGLFDLSTNPGEEQRLNFIYKQCDLETQTGQDAPAVTAVIDELRDADPSAAKTDESVVDWAACVSDPNCTRAY